MKISESENFDSIASCEKEMNIPSKVPEEGKCEAGISHPAGLTLKYEVSTLLSTCRDLRISFPQGFPEESTQNKLQTTRKRRASNNRTDGDQYIIRTFTWRTITK